MSASEAIKPKGVLSAGGVLDRIVEAKVKRLARAKRQLPLNQLITKCMAIGPSRARQSFRASISVTHRVNIIAEIKQRSPSKGVICADFDPVRIASKYAHGGAAALSVLCEEDFFGGSLDDLKAVRRKTRTPLLRKDFLFDEYQVYEAVAAHADAVLLIVAILDDELLAHLITLARAMGIDALVEAHTEDEFDRAVRAGARIIGVNNRDLKTFNVDLRTSVKLAQLAPADVILVSESGIATGAEIRRLQAAGYCAFLIGEHFMRANDPGSALQQLIPDASN